MSVEGTPVSNTAQLHNPIRPEWLATRDEAAIEPALPIVDAHHHLYERPGTRYLLEEFLADLGSGHNIRATVHVQARSMLRSDGPEPLKPVGETEFINGVAAMSASGNYGATRVCAGIVGFANLRLGDAVRPVLEAHVSAAGGLVTDGGRLCGIRQAVSWDADPFFMNPAYAISENMLDSREFRAGFAHLGALGLSFDAWLFFHQIPRLTALARDFPETSIVLDHCGGILGIGAYAGRQKEVFLRWKTALVELAACPNVMVKLGGLGMRMCGLSLDGGERAPSSIDLARAWRPWIDTCIETFGPARCMFESNFPVDKGSYSYGVGWNAMKRLCSGASTDEKANLFWRSATRFYRLPL